MDIAGYFIQRRVTSWLVTLVLGIGGLLAFLESAAWKTRPSP